MTGRYLTETESSGGAPARERERERQRRREEESVFLRAKAAFNESFTGEDEMPFLCAMKDGQKGGEEEENEGSKREKNNEEREGGKGGNFSVCIFHSKTF